MSFPESPAGLRQAQGTVRSAPNHVGIDIVLAVVLPLAHVADLVRAALAQRQLTTARACIRSTLGTGDHRPAKRVHVPVDPRLGALPGSLAGSIGQLIVAVHPLSIPPSASATRPRKVESNV